MVLIQRVGIMQADEESDLTVDAAIANPPELQHSAKRRKKSQK